MFEKFVLAVKMLLCVLAFAALVYGVLFAYEWLRDFTLQEGGTYYMAIPADRRITASQARTWIERYPTATILDVRSPQEYATGRIPGARLLPESDISARANYYLPDKNALILVYCRSGARAQSATQKLLAMGYTNVYDFGGIIDWPYDRE
jgi:rhodanese-related sulfurtransferase